MHAFLRRRGSLGFPLPFDIIPIVFVCRQHRISRHLELVDDLQDLLKYDKGNVLVFDKYAAQWLGGVDASKFSDCFEGCYYQLDLSEYKAERIDIRALEATKYYFDHLYKAGELPPVLIQDCYYLDKGDARNKIILNKIATGAAHEQSDDQYFKDLDEHWATIEPLFDKERWNVKEIFDEACDNTVKIAQGAKARFETGRNFMPQYDMTAEEKDMATDTPCF